jgi:dihydrofolate reductase
MTDAEATWENSVVVRGDVVAGITALRAEPGGALLVAGSRTLAATLIEEGLVDEYRLMVFPVVLGSGKRLFPDGGPLAKLALTEAKPAGGGIMMLTYRPAP